jgi:hypothetical protein
MLDNYYVYCFLDPTKPGKYCYDGLDFCLLYEPFYIGKGKGNRINRHFHKDSLRKESNILKKNKILKILGKGEDVIRVKIKDNLEEIAALNLEETIIRSIGRRDIKEGCLSNLSYGGEKGKNQNQENRKKIIIQYDIEGNQIKKFSSLKEASDELNISKGCISLCCNRKKHTYKNYIWRFEDDKDLEYNIGLSKNYKKIIRSFKDGSYIIYDSIKEAAKDIGLNSSNLINYLKGDVANKNLDIRYYDLEYDSQYKCIRDIKKVNGNSKPIIQLSIDGDFIRNWNSAACVAKEYEWSSSLIISCCKGLRKTAYKYKWIYKK